MHNFRKLKVWEEAIELAVWVYKATVEFATEELFGLISLMRRSAVSISSNIAEGAGRGTDAQFLHFLDISNGSANELISQSILSNRLDFLGKDNLLKLEDNADKVQRMIFNFKKQIS